MAGVSTWTTGRGLAHRRGRTVLPSGHEGPRALGGGARMKVSWRDSDGRELQAQTLSSPVLSG
ncbi:hypothetical protein MFU01_67330 [Myxococcus fulvus]|uniref:Uncharacterized protein n=1 Tax=Myxococcus fulvus TaxID=33 RepID=A0A511TBZ2_MYXFU|nr:hypothetical protein MFU01_67330 [Myxococcus fulvus]